MKFTPIAFHQHLHGGRMDLIAKDEDGTTVVFHGVRFQSIGDIGLYANPGEPLAVQLKYDFVDIPEGE